MTRALFLCLALGACAAGPTVQPPPARYRGDATVIVQLHPSEAIAETCEALGEGYNPRVVGCFYGLGIHLPNPCEWPDPFAQLFCHELAHANGWPANHPK